jgi:homoserine dehydrogenase
LKIALLGFGNVGRALARLLERQRASFPFRITGIHTARHGTAYGPGGLPADPAFGPAAASLEEFLDRAGAGVMVELTPLDPVSGEPAISHIRAAFARGLHVVTANKGPIAHAYAALREEAERAGVLFRFEATCMDGAPVYNLIRTALPGVRVLGFTGVLNSTTQVIIDAMRRGQSMEEGIQAARRLGVTEADAGYDIDGWDAAAKTAALANVLMDARTTPQQVDTRGIGRLTPEKLMELAARRKTVRLVSRARRAAGGGVRLRVRAEVVDETDILASVHGTSNLILFHTDLAGTIGTVSVSPGVDQTAYGVFADLVEVERALKSSP